LKGSKLISDYIELFYESATTANRFLVHVVFFIFSCYGLCNFMVIACIFKNSCMCVCVLCTVFIFWCYTCCIYNKRINRLYTASLLQHAPV